MYIPVQAGAPRKRAVDLWEKEGGEEGRKNGAGELVA